MDIYNINYDHLCIRTYVLVNVGLLIFLTNTYGEYSSRSVTKEFIQFRRLQEFVFASIMNEYTKKVTPFFMFFLFLRRKTLLEWE